MRYHYYGLILHLSIIIFSYVEIFSQTEPTKESTVTQAENLSKTLSELKELTKQLVSQYAILSNKVDTLTEQYQRLSQSISTPTFTTEEKERIYSLIESLNEKIIELSSKIEELSAQQEPQEPQQADVTEKTTPTPHTETTPQYVRVKVREPGQEIELYLDPTYVDMNLDVKRVVPEKKPEEPITKPKEEITKPKEEAKPKKEPTESKEEPIETKTPEDVVELVERTLRKRELRKEATLLSQEVINELHKAQKLYYARKYSAALNAVQKSLAKQETALGYALEGSIYFTLGDLDLAIESWQAALRLDPDMHEVRAILNRYKR